MLDWHFVNFTTFFTTFCFESQHRWFLYFLISHEMTMNLPLYSASHLGKKINSSLFNNNSLWFIEMKTGTVQTLREFCISPSPYFSKGFLSSLLQYIPPKLLSIWKHRICVCGVPFAPWGHNHLLSGHLSTENLEKQLTQFSGTAKPLFCLQRQLLQEKLPR